ncbi:MAG: ATP-dependent RNA helicase HrpA [Betaproteobacteria bacterium]|nr:MAG: ATP-dependent RNA helicase HrpA [Betaproteobacteria bacterium]
MNECKARNATTAVVQRENMLLADYWRIQRRAKQLKPDELSADVLRAEERFRARLERSPAITYAEGLPVSDRADEIASLIRNHQVVVLTGETGSGKTTQLPKIALAAGRGRYGLIGHTQPRRIAASSVATRIAKELGEEIGQSVGFKVRFTEKGAQDGFIKLMTDGILLAETQTDKFLNAYDTIIIDEAHERSLNIDFLLGYLRQLLPKRPDLKLIITSATIDAERFALHFQDRQGKPAPLIHVSGRTYPVEVLYRSTQTEEDDEEKLEEAIADAVDELWLRGAGDVLVFLPGEREIRETQDILRRRLKPGTEILPLFSRLSVQDQQKIFSGSSGRRVVLSTNVAETSLTVPGIRYVVDTGLARLNRYSVKNKVQMLQIEKISQASANQRSGRCGRVQAGVCIRLYSEEDFAARSAFTDPEILRSSLAGVILRLASLGLGRVQEFPFIEPPSSRAIADGTALLQELGALNEAGELTNIGRELSRIPVDPRIGRMLVEAKKLGVLAEVLVIASALSVPDPRERPFEARDAADRAHQWFKDTKSDFLSLINVWKFAAELREDGGHKRQVQACREKFLNWLRLREWRDLHGQLAQTLRELGWSEVSLSPRGRESVEEARFHENFHRALLPGLLGNIGVKAEDGDHYLGARGIKFYPFPGSGVDKKGLKWLVGAELAETTRLYARTLAKIDPEWIESAAGDVVTKNYFEPKWDSASGQVVASERVSLYGLTIVPRRRVSYSRIAPIEAHDIFCAALAMDEVETAAAFYGANKKLIKDIQLLEDKARRTDVLVSEETIAAFYKSRIPQDVCTRADLEKWSRAEANDQMLRMTREQLMRHGADAVTEDQFPKTLKLGDFEVPVSYRFEPNHPMDGVTVKLPLALLNAVEERYASWLIPGLWREKIAVLLKALPKAERGRVQPVPDTVTAFLELATPRERPLVEALLEFLRAYLNLSVASSAWDRVELPAHLRLNFRVMDGEGNELGMDRDLGKLQTDLGQAARMAFQGSQDSAAGDIEKTGLTAWTIGTLPEGIPVKRAGRNLTAYPACVDEGASVAVKLFETAAEADAAHRKGVVRLMTLELKSQLRNWEKGPSGFNQIALQLKTAIPTDKLLTDFLNTLADRAMVGDDALPRDEKAIREQVGRAKQRIPVVADALGRTLSAVAEAYAALQADLHKAGPRAKPLVTVLSQWRDRLLYPGFLSATPWAQLPHLARYLTALTRRLRKYTDSPEREVRHAPVLSGIWTQWANEMERQGGLASEDLRGFRWLIEELQVALFAQELKTPFPVSSKRLEKRWLEICR